MASPQSSPSAANLNLGIPEAWCSAGWSADIQYCLMYGVTQAAVLGINCKRYIYRVLSCILACIQGVELYAVQGVDSGDVCSWGLC